MGIPRRRILPVLFTAIIAKMIESVWVVVAVIIIMRIAAIAAAAGEIIGVRQREGSNEAEGGAGDEIGTSIVTHIDGVVGFCRSHGLRVEGR